MHPDIDGASCPLFSESICPGGFDRKILLHRPPQDAVVLSGIATFDIANIQMSNTVGFPMGYDVHELKEPLELASLDGTIVNGEPHIHGVVGNGNKTWAGHLLDGCRILYLGEVVIQEMLCEPLIRIADENGVFLISRKREIN